jgi:hypothetical protein
VLELTLEHICDSLEAAVRVIGEATILIDIKLVEHEERIVATELWASDGSTDTSTDTFGLFLREDGLCDGSGERSSRAGGHIGGYSRCCELW